MRVSTLVSVLALLVATSAARAEDPPGDAAALAAKIAELRKADDAAALKEAVKKVPEAHKAAADAAQKALLQDALGKVLKDRKAGDARVAAAEALAQLDDPKGAYRQLSGALPDPKADEATEVDLAVLKAVNAVADEKAIPALLDLAAKAKANAVAREAAEALGSYGSNKKKRVMVLEELISLGSRLQPSGGGGSGKQVSKEAQERWGEVGGAILRSLNRLTGQSIQQFPDWQTIYHENKKSVAKLFKDPA